MVNNSDSNSSGLSIENLARVNTNQRKNVQKNNVQKENVQKKNANNVEAKKVREALVNMSLGRNTKASNLTKMQVEKHFNRALNGIIKEPGGRHLRYALDRLTSNLFEMQQINQTDTNISFNELKKLVGKRNDSVTMSIEDGFLTFHNPTNSKRISYQLNNVELNHLLSKIFAAKRTLSYSGASVSPYLDVQDNRLRIRIVGFLLDNIDFQTLRNAAIEAKYPPMLFSKSKMKKLARNDSQNFDNVTNFSRNKLSRIETYLTQVEILFKGVLDGKIPLRDLKELIKLYSMRSNGHALAAQVQVANSILKPINDKNVNKQQKIENEPNNKKKQILALSNFPVEQLFTKLQANSSSLSSTPAIRYRIGSNSGVELLTDTENGTKNIDNVRRDFSKYIKDRVSFAGREEQNIKVAEVADDILDFCLFFGKYKGEEIREKIQSGNVDFISNVYQDFTAEKIRYLLSKIPKDFQNGIFNFLKAYAKTKREREYHVFNFDSMR